MNWLHTSAQLARDNIGFVLVTVMQTAGSTPRDAKSKMVVTADHTDDSIGGGNLEYQAIQQARALLRSGEPAVQSEVFSLGKQLTQCCGGKVTLLFECFPACRFHIALFGAGHVGAALVTMLARLPCRVRWLDCREQMLAAARETTPAPSQNIDISLLRNPFAAVEDCPPGAYYLIMTHSHELDFELCEAVLTRGDSRYCGLIGSQSKGAKFRSRLTKKGFTAAEIARLTCPIGLPSIRGKTPMQVAVSVAGQLLALHDETPPD